MLMKKGYIYTIALPHRSLALGGHSFPLKKA
jgi:hypothetical protein